MTSVRILGTGSYIPPLTVSNDDYAKFVETSDEWITTRTGMQKRHIAAEEPTWYMGTQAGKKALEAAGVSPDQIDMVLVTTVTSDYTTPAMACLIQGELGIPSSAFALDISVACTGLAFALDMARRYLATGDVEHVLIVNAESLTQITNYEDRGTCVLFGDGAGACVVTGTDGVFGSSQHCDPSGVPQLYAKRTRQSTPFGEAVQQSPHDAFEPVFRDALYMNGREVYKFTVKAAPAVIREACEKAGIAVEDLDLIIPHQANLRIIETFVKNLKFPMEKVYVNIQEYGNTSSATMAICLDECARGGRLQRGQKVCFVGFGAGLTYGATVLTY